jgi:hypothetical protein
MSSSWTGEGPVTLPSTRLTYAAAAGVFLLAVAGVGLGFRAAWRSAPEPGIGDSSSAALGDAVTAKPLVELPPPVTAPQPAKEAPKPDATASNAEKAKEDLAAQTAAAQAVQAKPSKPSQDIDDILTSTSEKPPAPVKPSSDEAPPPEKSDVPF